MSTLNWGSSSGPIFENGTDRGVVYPLGGDGIPWTGITSVTEDHSTSNEVIRYYDGQQYRSQITLGEFSAVVESYTYPDLLDDYELINAGLGTSSRAGNTYFNFSYRTLTDTGYKIHLVYNALAQSSTKSYSTIGASTDAVLFSWNIVAVPVPVPGARASAHFIVDSTVARPEVLERLENLLYGSVTSNPQFPTLDELIAIFEEGSVLHIIDHGDGTWTATGPDDMVKMISATEFEIVSPSAVYIGPDEYKVSSY